ncbi:MAG: hypothetical protein QOJ89_4367 [bacterium]
MPRPERRDDVAITGAGAGSPLGAGARDSRERGMTDHGADAVRTFHGRDHGGRNATLQVEAA